MAKNKNTNKNSLYDIDYYKSLKGKEAMQQRLSGRLPIIDIADYPFFADARIGYLRPLDNFSTMGINITDIPMAVDTKTLSFYYHIPTMERVTIPENITEYPKDVVMVTTPNRYILDPVGMAYANDKKADYYLDGETPKMYRTAKITPLPETAIAAVIKRNIEKQSASAINIRGNVQPVQKRKRGMGL